MSKANYALSEHDVVALTIVIGFCTFLLVLKASSAFRERLGKSNETETAILSSLDSVPPAVDLQTSSGAKESVHDPRTTVLVVDDDPVTRMQLRRHLEKLKFRVMEVPDGPSAVKSYEEGKRFCLVLMDYEMPDMNGLLATRIIRGFDNDVVIVGSTIHDPATKQDDFLKAGANLVDIKPISADRLQELVSEYNLTPTE